VDLNGTATAIRQAAWTVYQDALHAVWSGNGYAAEGSAGQNQASGQSTTNDLPMNRTRYTTLNSSGYVAENELGQGKRLAYAVDLKGTLRAWVEDDQTPGDDDSATNYAYTLVGPVSIRQMDACDRVIDLIEAVRVHPNGKLKATDQFPQNSWTRWTSFNYDINSRLTWQRVYFLIPANGEGNANVNYNETDYGYDTMGRQIKTVTPAGTITRRVLAPRGKVLSEWVGTDDNGATESAPTGGGTSGNNLVQTLANVYDNGTAGGDGMLTQVTEYVTTADTRVTTYGYDFRQRQIWTDGECDLYRTYAYDNEDRLIQEDWHDTTVNGNLVSRNTTAYDNLGRIYQKQQYGVDPATGAVGNALTQAVWYDEAHNVILTQDQNGRGFTKNTYDGLNRLTASYKAANATAQTYATASAVTEDIVVEQTETTYDEASNPIFQTTGKRNHDTTGIGILDAATARIGYQALYPDPLGRVVAMAVYGTNGGYVVTRSAVTPTPSDTILVVYSNFDEAGNLTATVDAQGAVTKYTFDQVGRVVQKVENYQVGGSGADVGKITMLAYHPGGQLASLTAGNSVTGDQVTQWVYGVDTTNSAAASNELLRAKVYPDGDQSIYGYNRQGQVTQRNDPNGTARQLDYDKLGRLQDDSVTTLGNGVDGTIRRISRGYEVRGLLHNVTSYDAPENGTVVNEVCPVFNSFQQLQACYQSHSGVADTGSTPHAAFAYQDGTNNSTRPIAITYPNGRVFNYSYGAANSLDDLLDRVTNIGDANTANLAAYERLGLNHIVLTHYPEAGLALTYVKLAGEPNGDGGDQYAGLDRFDRLADVRWLNSSGTDVNRFKYGFDRADNRLWKQHAVTGGGIDEQYVYDGLYQLKQRLLGTLAGSTITGAVNEEEDFTFDPTGNWPGYVIREQGVVTLNQARTHQQSNEITSLGGVTDTIGYDNNGNLAVMPKVRDWGTGQTLVYDAWNRLVAVQQNGAAVESHQYDGMDRRIWKQSAMAGTRHFYYNNRKQWQVLEERLDDNATADRQYLWGLRYHDDLILRDDAAGRLYALSDHAQVTAVADATGTVQERYIYRAFGGVGYYDGNFTPLAESAHDWTFLFGGYQLDQATNLYQVRNRYYHANLGRWLTRDPLDEPELSQGANLYAYVNNNPVNATDPLGLAAVIVIPVGAFTIAALQVLLATIIVITIYDIIKSTVCPPCPPPPAGGSRTDCVPPSKQHYPCTGPSHTHVWYFVMHQVPFPVCSCFPKKIESIICH
jgi:RHS repeat-associated protein